MTEKELEYHNRVSWVAKHLFRLWGWQWGVLLPHNELDAVDYELVGCRRVLESGDYWPIRDYHDKFQFRVDVMAKRKELGLLTDVEQLVYKDLLYSDMGMD